MAKSLTTMDFWITVAKWVHPDEKQAHWLTLAEKPSEPMRGAYAAWGNFGKYTSAEPRIKDFEDWAVLNLVDNYEDVKNDAVEHETSDYKPDSRDDVYNPPPSHSAMFSPTIALTVTAQTRQGLNLQVQTVHLLPTEKHAQFVSERLVALVRVLRHSADMASLNIVEVTESAQPQPDLQNELIQPADSLRVGYDDKANKKFARVRGGKFSEWGVPIYPEVMIQHGWELEKMEVGTNVPLSGQMVVQLKDGKPQRVLRLVL